MFNHCFPTVLPSHDPAICLPLLLLLVVVELKRVYTLFLHPQPLSIWFLSMKSLFLRGTSDSRPKLFFFFFFAFFPLRSYSYFQPLNSTENVDSRSWLQGCTVSNPTSGDFFLPQFPLWKRDNTYIRLLWKLNEIMCLAHISCYYLHPHIP